MVESLSKEIEGEGESESESKGKGTKQKTDGSVIEDRKKHLLKNLTTEKGRKKLITFPVGCFKCGGRGHLSRQCPTGEDTGVCFRCGEKGHLHKNCTKPFLGVEKNGKKEAGDDGGGRPRRVICFKCGKEGHISPHCMAFLLIGPCYKCGKIGHLQAKCTDGDEKSRITGKGRKKMGRKIRGKN
eukprot:TRINITY_DN962_c0_g7_i2.p1 TRINITY_DN962_c0_g7~~TRINITY_DN962_c0_g7_i2.p1  ORF type:complete len:184 (-),score=53.85 TRINITY_DN962_c0_g7_i2:411-962(-)